MMVKNAIPPPSLTALFFKSKKLNGREFVDSAANGVSEFLQEATAVFRDGQAVIMTKVMLSMFKLQQTVG